MPKKKTKKKKILKTLSYKKNFSISMGTAIGAPDRLHGRLQTTTRVGKSMNWCKPLGLLSKASESARIFPPMRSKFSLIQRRKGIMFGI